MRRALTGVALLLLARAAFAATITVNSTRDNTVAGDGKCTLREAVANVNAAGDTTNGDCTAGSGTGDTIVFNLRLPARIALRGEALDIQKEATILGPDTTNPTRLRIAAYRDNPAVGVAPAVTASISNLTVRSGRGSRIAIGIDGNGTLTNCILDGAGNDSYIVSNGGTLTLTNCTLRNNRATAIENWGALTMSSCTVTRTFGALGNAGTATMTGTALSGNHSPWGGSAIDNFGGRDVSLTNCTLYGNTTRNGDGAIFNNGSLDEAIVTVTNSTLYANTNPWHLDGHAIANFSGYVYLTNTLIGLPRARASNCLSIHGGITAGGHNLSSDFSCGADLVSAAMNVAPLGNYGGPTKTAALCTGVGVPCRTCRGASPALDAGDDAVTEPPRSLTTDQRGLPRLSGAHVDIGAYEAQ